MVVAEAARNWRASGEILLDKWLHYIALEAVFVIDDVIGDAQSFGDAACIVDVVERAASALYCLGHAFVSRQSSLVPELHGQTDDVVSLGAEHGRNGRRIDSA